MQSTVSEVQPSASAGGFFCASLLAAPASPSASRAAYPNAIIVSHATDFLARSFLILASRSLVPYKGAHRATAQEVHVAAFFNRWIESGS
jgi:hypothetical protein